MKIPIGNLRSIMRRDLYSFMHGSFCELNPETEFLPNWHLQVLAAALLDCWRGVATRLIINVPPRSLKSLLASIVFPAYVLGHNPSEQIICVSYAQELANSLASQCRTLMSSAWYRSLFRTRLSPHKQAVNEFRTTQEGFRMATSVGGVLTGRGGNFIIIDDPLKPDQAISEVERKSVNDWFLHSLSSRLNDKRTGCIILIMQRLHEDDLVGHVLNLGQPWKVLRFPAIAEEDEIHRIDTPLGPKEFRRKAGEALHPDREPLELLEGLRKSMGESHFAGQYQQSPTSAGGNMVKLEWFKRYTDSTLPSSFDYKFQSWDTANKATELSDFTVCTTWGIKEKYLYLLHVLRKRLDYPDLKRAVKEQAATFNARLVIIEDKASGTQLIQDLVSEGMSSIKRYQNNLEKRLRMSAASSIIENQLVWIPQESPWLRDYLHEIEMFPNGKFDDQVDSTSQALDWYKQEGNSSAPHPLVLYWQKVEAEKNPAIPPSMTCKCGQPMGRFPGGFRCLRCGREWKAPNYNLHVARRIF